MSITDYLAAKERPAVRCQDCGSTEVAIRLQATINIDVIGEADEYGWRRRDHTIEIDRVEVESVYCTCGRDIGDADVAEDASQDVDDHLRIGF